MIYQAIHVWSILESRVHQTLLEHILHVYVPMDYSTTIVQTSV